MISVVGLGPGDPRLLTPEAAAALDQAEDLVGYAAYLDRVAARPGQVVHRSDNGFELDRACHALRLAEAGRRVAVVSGGDPGVFAMAAALFEAIDHGPPAWRTLEVRVVPGVSALMAAAARIGAPLGHDFCTVSLSDNLKPWDVVIARLLAAAQAGFVLALFNPASRARPWQLGAALTALAGVLPGATPVAFATAVTRPDERLHVTTLAEADAAMADMRTLVLVGTAAMRRIDRPGASPWLYAPRSAA